MQANTRRKFLRDCSVATLGILVAPVAGAVDAAQGETRVRNSTLGLDEFRAQIDTNFTIHAPDGREMAVRLEDVRVACPSTQPPASEVRGELERFSLRFRGSRHNFLPQETYEFSHGKLGRFSYFIVPIHTKNPDTIDYEAVVCQIRSAGLADMLS
jgi:hypothetical protein